VRILVGGRRIQPDELEQLAHARLLCLARADLVNDERLPHRGPDAHARVQRRVRILEDDLKVSSGAAKLGRRQRPHVHVLEDDLAGRGFDEPQDAPARRRLPRTGFTDQAEGFARLDVKRHVIHRTHARCLAEEPPRTGTPSRDHAPAAGASR
jgi:hypothetical protein